jgi:hypothetical protein
VESTTEQIRNQNMSESFTDETKQSLIIAASIVAGPNASSADVAKHVQRIGGYLNPASDVQRAFVQMDKDAAATVKTSGFIGTIIGFAKEETSKRGVVMFHTSVTTHTPEAKEHLRTDFLDDGGPVSDMMNAVKDGLVGHKVQVQFDLVKKNDGSGHSVRVLRSITDRGVDPEYNANDSAYQPFYVDGQKANSIAKLTMFPRVPVAA